MPMQGGGLNSNLEKITDVSIDTESFFFHQKHNLKKLNKM